MWDIWLTNHASGEPVVSADLFDVFHVSEKLVEVRFRINRGGVGGSHAIWVTRESHLI